MRYGVLGAGRQGIASAYDLGRFGDAEKIVLWDVDAKVATDAANRVNKLLARDIAEGFQLDVIHQDQLDEALAGIDALLCAVPYKYILPVTQSAIQHGVHMVDLGGHTQTVRRQLELSDQAKSKGISIVPDCGMGPGMNITMALLSMEQMDQPQHVRIWDGGLPQVPKQPWNYSLFFNINGLTNEFDGSATFLRDGSLQEVPCFSDQELLDFGPGIGKLEAAVTSGGLSTMPWTYSQRLKTLENKTLRYPGHWEWMRAYRQLGLFEETPIEYRGQMIVPREFYHHLLEPQLDHGRIPDICLMRVHCDGFHRGKQVRTAVNTVMKYDEKTGFLAMEIWTGWHASIMLIRAVTGQLEKGVVSVENALSGSEFVKDAERRGYIFKVGLEES